MNKSNTMELHVRFGLCVLLMFQIDFTSSSMLSDRRAEHLLESICKHLPEVDSLSIEDRKWERFCEKWNKITRNYEPIEEFVDESSMRPMFSARKSGSRSGSRSSSSRTSSGSSRSSGGTRTSSSRVTSRITRYRSTRNGAVINRPVGWLWSRSRHVFLPVSQHYSHRSRSSTSRFTTPTTGIIYYYCTPNGTVGTEIQCNQITNDQECCEDETTHEPFCCGGKIDEDLIEDFNHATELLARVFYTLSAITLFIHMFYRRFYR